MMGMHLDLDDVREGHPEAKKELADLRAQLAAIIEQQDVDPAFKLRMASSIRSLKEKA